MDNGRSTGWAGKIRTFIRPLLYLHILLCACGLSHATADTVQRLDVSQIKRIVSDLQPLDFSRQRPHTSSEKRYFRFYGLDFEGTRHLFGSFKSHRFDLAAHVFLPEKPQGTAVLMHGYFDHAGVLKNLIQYCLKRSWAVAVFDLPGHGLSSGKRLSIDRFSEYAGILNDFIRFIQPAMTGPWFLIGHSTGCSVIYEYIHIRSGQWPEFNHIVFLAPLVRHPFWLLSTMNYRLAKPFTDSFPRKYKKNSSDDDFLVQTKLDPLQEGRFPIQWLEALYSWNKKIQDYDRLPVEILIIQGKDDSVVDWRYNIPFLIRKFDLVTVGWIPDARHQLVNEIPSIRGQVFNFISSHIK